MFEYFPENYAWNLAVLMAADLGGQMSEIDEACRPLRALGDASPEARSEAWFAHWHGLARRLERLAEADRRAGHALSAGRKDRRACVYYFTAERMTSHHDPRKRETYDRALAAFRRHVASRDARVEFIDIPYGAAFLPALLVTPARAAPAPWMIHFDGFDVTKEWTYLTGIADEFALRGLATLIVDHPGVGGALRLHGLTTSPHTEDWARACLDHMADHRALDADRVGIIAMSLGGYYAPRAAAFEKRLKCCVAWGARWDNDESHGRILRNPDAARSITDWVEHAKWVYGCDTVEALGEAIAKMTLDGVADRIECPLLVVQGENDRQVPIEQAHRTVDAAVKSPKRTLKIFTAVDGGAEHCQGDNFSLGIDYMADWIADVLGADTSSGQGGRR